MSLTSKLIGTSKRKMVVGTLALTSLLYGAQGGCNTMQAAGVGAAALSGLGNPRDPRSMRSAAVLGLMGPALLQADGNNAVRESGDNVNVNVYNQQPQQVPAPVVLRPFTEEERYAMGDMLMVFNYWEDFNHNELADYNELFGIKKSVFSQSEKITIAASIRNKKGAKLSHKLYDSNGVFMNFDDCVADRDNLFARNVLEPGSLKPGNYVASWDVNDQNIGSIKFEIKE